MNKTTQKVIIGIGIASILFALYGIVKGQEFIDALGGLVIGASLIGSVLIYNNKKE